MDPKETLEGQETATNPDEEAIIRCETTAGTFTMKMIRNWSPRGYDRAVELFERNFYDQSHFFRVVPKFLTQFGISYTTDKELQTFAKTPIVDDPQLDPPIPFREGIISFAGSGDNSRTSHLFISFGNAKSLGTQKWETPIGQVIAGMDNLRHLYSYGDIHPFGPGPAQGKINNLGRKYIEEEYPQTDEFKHCKVQRSSALDKRQEKQRSSLRHKSMEDFGIEEDPMPPKTYIAAAGRAWGSVQKLMVRKDYREIDEVDPSSAIVFVMSSVMIITILLLMVCAAWRCNKRRGKPLDKSS